MSILPARPGNVNEPRSLEQVAAVTEVKLSRSQEEWLADGAACLEAALAYQSLCWSVLSLCPPDHVGVRRKHGKECTSPGKRPWHYWRTFQEQRATRKVIEGWWRDQPAANVGVALGPVSGLVRIDVDGAEARQELQRLAGADLPDTLVFTGGSDDSLGLLFSIPAGVMLPVTRAHRGLALGELRFQSEGGQTALPPSRHVSGRRYRWLDGHGPNDIAVALMPDWLVESMRPGRRPNGRVLLDHRQDAPAVYDHEAQLDRPGERSADHPALGGTRGAPAQPFALGVPVDAMIEQAIAATLPTAFGQRNRRVFDLAQLLRRILPEATADQLQAILEAWFARALPFIRTKAWSVSWKDFLVAWDNVKWPGSGSFQAVAAQADQEIPLIARRYDGPLLRLVSLCWHLQRQAGAQPFPLSCRKAAEFLGLSKSRAQQLLAVLEDDLVLVLVKKGKQSPRPGPASYWQFLGLGAPAGD
jgi:hypothetical protein